jgi:membrane-associated protease RseP (regulator of RpoE activity)
MIELPGFVDVYFLSVMVFCGILAYAIYRDRKNIEFHLILIIRRTQRGKKLLDRIAKLSPRFWKVASTIYVIAAFVGMVYGLYMMGMSAKLIVDRTLDQPALQFILPFPQSQPASGPGFLLVPFWFWIILIPFFMIPHEMSHGIIARAHKIRLKSVGALLLAVIPGAFVEPDEKVLKKAKPLTKLRVYSAGSMANIILVFLLVLFTSQILWPSLVQSGLDIVEVYEDGPAAMAGISAGMKLEEIDGKPVNVAYNDFEISYSVLLLSSANVTAENTKSASAAVAMIKILSTYEAGDSIDLVADGEHYTLELAESPTNSTLPYMGVTIGMDEKRPAEFEFSTLLPLIWWTSTMGFAVAIFNLLPMYPFDGGLMVGAVAEKIFGRNKKAETAMKVVTIATAALIAFNFVGPFILQFF